MSRSITGRPSIGDVTEDDLKCADRMRAVIQSLTGEGYADNAIIWSFNMAFYELVHRCGGGDSGVLSSKALFPQLFQIEQDDATNCYRHPEKMIAALREEGFTYFSIMCCLIAAIRNIYEGMEFPNSAIEDCEDKMMQQVYACRDFPRAIDTQHQAKNRPSCFKIIALSEHSTIQRWTDRMSLRGLIRRIPAKINESGVEIVLAGLATAVAVAIAVAFSNVLLLPLRVYLTGAVTASVIDERRYKELSLDPGIFHVAYLVRARGYSDFIPIAMCDPKVTGNSIAVIESKVAATTVAVNGNPTLIKVYLGLDGPAGSSFMFALLLACGLTLYRAKTILRFGSTEVRTAWAPVTFDKVGRWKSLIKASEVLTDFLFLGLIFVATGIVVYAMFRTTLYIHGEIWFSVLALGTLAMIWSSIPLKVITFAWKTYKTPLFLIVRNLVSGLLMLGSIRTIYKMPGAAEFTSVHGFLTFMVAVLKVSIGLDAK